MQKAAIRILLEAGEPDALKDACPVREGGAGKGLEVPRLCPTLRFKRLLTAW